MKTGQEDDAKKKECRCVGYCSRCQCVETGDGRMMPRRRRRFERKEAATTLVASSFPPACVPAEDMGRDARSIATRLCLSIPSAGKQLEEGDATILVDGIRLATILSPGSQAPLTIRNVPLEQFIVLCGNEADEPLHEVSLKQYLSHFRMFLSQPDGWPGLHNTLLSPRDEVMDVSLKFIPIPCNEFGDASFNVCVGGRSSTAANSGGRIQATLVIVASSKGTSAQLVNGSGQVRLWFNDKGQCALFAARDDSTDETVSVHELVVASPTSVIVYCVPVLVPSSPPPPPDSPKTRLMSHSYADRFSRTAARPIPSSIHAQREARDTAWWHSQHYGAPYSSSCPDPPLFPTHQLIPSALSDMSDMADECLQTDVTCSASSVFSFASEAWASGRVRDEDLVEQVFSDMPSSVPTPHYLDSVRTVASTALDAGASFSEMNQLPVERDMGAPISACVIRLHLTHTGVVNEEIVQHAVSWYQAEHTRIAPQETNVGRSVTVVPWWWPEFWSKYCKVVRHCTEEEVKAAVFTDGRFCTHTMEECEDELLDELLRIRCD